MKTIFVVIISAFFLAGAKAQEPSPSPRPVDSIPRFAEYGNIRFSDEQALLDHLASSFRKAPDHVIYFLVYSDWRSCQRQGKTRAVRAINYLVKHHGIKADRVVWKDGGFRSDLSVEVWLVGSDADAPEPFPIFDQLKLKQMRKRRCHKGKGVQFKSSAAHNIALQLTARQHASQVILLLKLGC
jgi:hypothetical protein